MSDRISLPEQLNSAAVPGLRRMLAAAPKGATLDGTGLRAVGGLAAQVLLDHVLRARRAGANPKVLTSPEMAADLRLLGLETWLNVEGAAA